MILLRFLKQTPFTFCSSLTSWLMSNATLKDAWYWCAYTVTTMMHLILSIIFAPTGQSRSCVVLNRLPFRQNPQRGTRLTLCRTILNLSIHCASSLPVSSSQNRSSCQRYGSTHRYLSLEAQGGQRPSANASAKLLS